MVLEKMVIILIQLVMMVAMAEVVAVLVMPTYAHSMERRMAQMEQMALEARGMWVMVQE
jgi:hypothetical protein